MPAARQAEVVEELNAPLGSIRRRRELSTEDANAGDVVARPEGVYGVAVVSVAYGLEAKFIRQTVAEDVRLAENKSVIPAPYVEARRWREEASDAGVMLTVIGQAISEE